jgi:hypothetical protein
MMGHNVPCRTANLVSENQEESIRYTNFHDRNDFAPVLQSRREYSAIEPILHFRQRIRCQIISWFFVEQSRGEQQRPCGFQRGIHVFESGASTFLHQDRLAV